MDSTLRKAPVMQSAEEFAGKVWAAIEHYGDSSAGIALVNGDRAAAKLEAINEIYAMRGPWE